MAVQIIKSEKIRICGFCMSNNHDKCVIGTWATPRTKYPEGTAVSVCQCDADGCDAGGIKCQDCKTRDADLVDPDTWKCFDRDACRHTIEARHAANPLYADLREAKERAKMAKIEQTEAKAEQTAKAKEPTFCLVTGEPTKGGLFKPGMDARYVSIEVQKNVDAKFTKTAEAASRKKLKDDGVSDKLVAKFDKQLNIAREKVEKAKAAAEAKEKAKAEKAAADKS